MKNSLKLGLVLFFSLLAIKKAGAASASPALPSHSNLGDENKPRGIRNNNPGNLKITSIPWQGKLPLHENTDGVFEQFSQYRYGVRAMIKDLRNDYQVDGKTNLWLLISSYAPASENNVNSYVSAVSARTGIDPYQKFADSKDVWKRIVAAMAHHENGTEAVTPAQFEEAWKIL